MTPRTRIAGLAAILAGTLFSGAWAQTQIRNPYPIRSKPQPSLSKAGAVQPRPSVPNRNVALPPGASYGVYYYYGYSRYYGVPQGSYRERERRDRDEGIPGLVTRPGESWSRSD